MQLFLIWCSKSVKKIISIEVPSTPPHHTAHIILIWLNWWISSFVRNHFFKYVFFYSSNIHKLNLHKPKESKGIKKIRRNTFLFDFLVLLFVIFINHASRRSLCFQRRGENAWQKKTRMIMYIQVTWSKNRNVKVPLHQSEVTTPFLSRSNRESTEPQLNIFFQRTLQ